MKNHIKILRDDYFGENEISCEVEIIFFFFFFYYGVWVFLGKNYADFFFI